jgi:hypothetical protein
MSVLHRRHARVISVAVLTDVGPLYAPPAVSYCRAAVPGQEAMCPALGFRIGYLAHAL